VLIADEPVSALDLINLLLDLEEPLGLSMIVVSHNMAVVRPARCPVAVAARATEPGLLPLPDHPERAAACWHAIERPTPLSTEGRPS
jgi:ABC-type dipeptide/oligopeptide/nickel transport system ATPase component